MTARPSAADHNAAAPPGWAGTVFGPALADLTRYAELLAADAVPRGLLGPREIPRIWDRHLANSAALAPCVVGVDRVVDIGSGAGLPGIPLALLRPDVDVTLLEPMQRRVRFLDECVAALPSSNITVVRGRAEEVSLPGLGGAVARAVAPLPRLAELASALLPAGGVLWALKGQAVDDEISDLRRAGPAADITVTSHTVAGSTTKVVRVVLPARRRRGRSN